MELGDCLRSNIILKVNKKRKKSSNSIPKHQLFKNKTAKKKLDFFGFVFNLFFSIEIKE